MTAHPARQRCRAALGAALLAAAAGAAADPFTFDWPVPSTVAVRARMQKQDTTSTARYRVELRAADAGRLALSFEDFEFLTLNGVDAQTPEVRDRLGPLAALTASLPTMALSPAGEYLGTVGLEAMTARMLALIPEASDAALRERLEGYFASPQVRRMMQQKSGETWNVWVGAWNGLELAPGESRTLRVPVTLMEQPLDRSVLFEHLGAAPQRCPACVHLRLTTLVEGPEVVALVSGIVREASGSAPPAGFTSARSMNVAEVVTEADGLRPHYALSITEVSLSAADGAEHRRSERREYWFQWRE